MGANRGKTAKFVNIQIILHLIYFHKISALFFLELFAFTFHFLYNDRWIILTGILPQPIHLITACFGLSLR